MKKFAIITDSSSDLCEEIRKKYDIECVNNRFFIGEKQYEGDPDWKNYPIKEFYDYMRAGNRITTSQISTNSCRETFEKCLKEGYDILSLSCPGVLSSTVNVCYHTRDELQKLYPERKIICIDTCISSSGLGILCLMAAQLREEGNSLEEGAAWVEENKKYINQEGTVEDLTYLKRACRVSAASAFFGGLLNIKPMVISDVHGYNIAVEKAKGRKKSLIRTAERVAENYTNDGYKGIFIHHADCLKEALEVKQEILNRIDIKEEDVHTANINAVIGASVGPGMVGVFFFGKEVTYNSKEK